MLGPAPGPSREESELCGKRGGGGTLDKTEFVRVLMRRVGRGDESTGSVQNFLRLDQSGLYAGAEVALDWIHLRSLQGAHLKTLVQLLPEICLPAPSLAEVAIFFNGTTIYSLLQVRLYYCTPTASCKSSRWAAELDSLQYYSTRRLTYSMP